MSELSTYTLADERLGALFGSIRNTVADDEREQVKRPIGRASAKCKLGERETRSVCYVYAFTNGNRRLPARLADELESEGWKLRAKKPNANRTQTAHFYYKILSARDEYVIDWIAWANELGLHGPYYGIGHVIAPTGSGKARVVRDKRNSRARARRNECLRHVLPCAKIGIHDSETIAQVETFSDYIFPYEQWEGTVSQWVDMCERFPMFPRLYNYLVAYSDDMAAANNPARVQWALDGMKILEQWAGEYKPINTLEYAVREFNSYYCRKCKSVHYKPGLCPDCADNGIKSQLVARGTKPESAPPARTVAPIGLYDFADTFADAFGYTLKRPTVEALPEISDSLEWKD